MKIANYICESCNIITSQKFEIKEKVPTSIICSCGKKSIRDFDNISSNRESEEVSNAIQTMLYGALPSTKAKRVY